RNAGVLGSGTMLVAPLLKNTRINHWSVPVHSMLPPPNVWTAPWNDRSGPTAHPSRSRTPDCSRQILPNAPAGASSPCGARIVGSVDAAVNVSSRLVHCPVSKNVTVTCLVLAKRSIWRGDGKHFLVRDQQGVVA